MKSVRYLLIRLEDLTRSDGFQIWQGLSRLSDFKPTRKSDDSNTQYVIHRGSKLPSQNISNIFDIYKFNGTKLTQTKQCITILGGD